MLPIIATGLPFFIVFGKKKVNMGGMIPRTALFLREEELRRGAILLQAASQRLTASEAELCKKHQIGPAQTASALLFVAVGLPVNL